MSTIGADPELFLEKNGETVIAIGKLGGVKGKPIDIGDGYGVQEDNIMAEYNIAPQSDAYRFAEVVVEGVRRVRDFARAKLKDHAIEVSEKCEVELPLDLLQEYPEAMEFGCSAEFDGYRRGAMTARVEPRRFLSRVGQDATARRFAGGHVHLGYENPNEIPEFVVACFADLWLCLPTLHLDPQDKRRSLYGAGGRYRPTAYGIEYRTLSNFWVRDVDTAARIGFQAKGLMGAIESADPGALQRLFKQMPWRDVREAIIRGDQQRARRLLNHAQRIVGLGILEY